MGGGFECWNAFGKQYQYRTADQRWSLIGSEMSVYFERLDSTDKVELDVQWKWNQVGSRGKKRKRRLARMIEGSWKSHDLIRHRDPSPRTLFPRGRPRTRVGKYFVGVSMHVTRTNEISP